MSQGVFNVHVLILGSPHVLIMCFYHLFRCMYIHSTIVEFRRVWHHFVYFDVNYLRCAALSGLTRFCQYTLLSILCRCCCQTLQNSTIAVYYSTLQSTVMLIFEIIPHKLVGSDMAFLNLK